MYWSLSQIVTKHYNLTFLMKTSCQKKIFQSETSKILLVQKFKFDFEVWLKLKF